MQRLRSLSDGIKYGLVMLVLLILLYINKWGEVMGGYKYEYPKENNIQCEKTINEICDVIEYGDIRLYYTYMENMYLTYDYKTATDIKSREQNQLKKIKEFYGMDFDISCNFKNSKSIKYNERTEIFDLICEKLGLTKENVEEIYEVSNEFTIKGNNLESTVNINTFIINGNESFYSATDILDEIYKKIFINEK